MKEQDFSKSNLSKASGSRNRYSRQAMRSGPIPPVPEPIPPVPEPIPPIPEPIPPIPERILPIPEPIPLIPEQFYPFPWPPGVSGLYEYTWNLSVLPPPEPVPAPVPTPVPTPTTTPTPTITLVSTPTTMPLPMPASKTLLPWWFKWFIRKEELRLDVDGHYPQMVASGILHISTFYRVHWIANLAATGTDSWAGNIWYKDGDVASFHYTNVDITVVRSWYTNQRRATVTFSGGGDINRVVTFKFKSRYFHPVDFEFDRVPGEALTTSIGTCDHPNRPTGLPCETLTVQEVYQRAGFDVTTSAGGLVPLTGAGAGSEWSNQEMHDAMQTYWSHFSSLAQWAIWVFFASLHEWGTDLGGIMFDDIGTNHRQGTAVFNDSFVSEPPAGEADPDEWVRRMLFWTTCHEMGHCFNLAHSWQKSLGTPWIGLADDTAALSFMNYPYYYPNGPYMSGNSSADFFADFEFRFSDQELLFMRHAPVRFVQPGNADWFDDHGFEQADVSSEAALRLELRVNREKAIFEFMEPVTLELKLTNVSSQPQFVDENILSAAESMIVILKKDRRQARQLIPYAQYCWRPARRVLAPGESVYESLFVSAGQNGWDMAEPGYYTVQVALRVGREDIVSNPLRVRVAPPYSYDEELLAQDFFSDDVGRIIVFNGSRFLVNGNDILHEVAERLPFRHVACYASLALGNGVANEYKHLVEDPKNPRKLVGIKIEPAKPKEARKLLATALTTQTSAAAEALGHIEFKRQVDHYSDWLARQGSIQEAVKYQSALYQIMSTRQIHGRKILDGVVRGIRERRGSYKVKK